jgi:signal transduction histidine kinase
VEVEDTGCGMDTGTLAHIFEPFFTTKAAGRGLGLAGVLDLLRTDGGCLEVGSCPGKGSTFRVLLPVFG